METVFKLGFIPTYHKPQVNYRLASVKNILKSLYLNKFRYLTRYLIYRRMVSNLSKMKTTGELAAITSLVRPGPLSFK